PAPADCQDLDLINVNKRKAPSYSFGGKYVEYVGKSGIRSFLLLKSDKSYLHVR
ncbi:hypothetical protein BgiBS90_033681, partial [Biomphalaria glabrata]